MNVVVLSLVALEAALCSVVPQVQPVVDRDPRLFDFGKEAHHGVARCTIVLLKDGIGNGIVVDARKRLPRRLLRELIICRLTLCSSRKQVSMYTGAIAPGGKAILRSTISSSWG